MRDVRAPTAPSQANENGECPPVCRHGWKWSEMATLSKVRPLDETIETPAPAPVVPAPAQGEHNAP